MKLKVPDLATWVERQRDGTEWSDEPLLPTKEALPRLVIAFNNIGIDEIEDNELFQPAQTFLKHSPWKDAPSLKFLRIPSLPGTTLKALLLSEDAHAAGIRLREAVLAA